MRKNVIIISTLLISSAVFSQVGINSVSPASTLDVVAKNSTGTTNNVDGLLIPRVDRERAQSMTGVPTSTLIYVNSIATGSQTLTAANIDATGYYYFDGALWAKLNSGGSGGTSLTNSTTNTISGNTVERAALNGDVTAPANSNTTTIAANAVTSAKILDNEIVNADLSNVASGVGGIYKGSGSLSGNTTVTQNANRLAFTSSATNGFSVDGTTLSVDAANNRLGVGTSTPTANLDVNGNMRLGTAAATTGSSGYSTIVRENATGILKISASSTGNTYPMNYITYVLSNVNGDWVSDYDTKISSSDYSLAIVGSSFSNGLTAGGGADFNPFNVLAFVQGGTWHLSADYLAANSIGGNGTWQLRCLIINNTMIKTLSDVSQNLGGSNTASALNPPTGL